MPQGPLGRLGPLLRPAAFLLAFAAVSARAQGLETIAPQALLIDHASGAVLLEKNADVPVPPASMSKLMTVYLALEAVRDGLFTMDSELPVSEEAWRKGGSKMFVEVGTKVRLEDLLRGIIVQSGNDACIVVAEAISGSEERFAELMNARGRELGLEGSTFANSTGWPDPNHRMSLRDIATITVRLLEDFPEHFPMFAETEFTYGGIRQGNRNPLLYQDVGADGMKTGHTEEAGYGLAATARRGDRRVVLVVNGLGSERERTAESTRLVELAFTQYQSVRLAVADEEVATARVWLGRDVTVPLVRPEPIDVTLPRGPMRRETTITLRYTGPIEAPVAKGEAVAVLVVDSPSLHSQEFPLLAGADVPRLGFVGRLAASFGYLVWGDP